jgi:RNA polymerase sigma factor (sigma-70 family)
VPFEELPEPSMPILDPEVRASVKRATSVLAALPARDRTAFVERFVDGMKLRDMAEAHGVSLSTIKRTVSRAEKRFLTLTRRDPMLRDCLESSRWQVQ